MQHINLSALAFITLSLSASAQITVDGTRVGDAYGTARAIQTVNTAWGNNMNELNAAYATVENGRLHLMITGNVSDIFNNIEIFIDSVPGGENVLSGLPGHGTTPTMGGFTFDAGFEPDYHVFARRGIAGTPQFNLDISRLGTGLFSQHLSVFGASMEGAGTTGTGPANAVPIEVAYDNSNVGGITAGETAANPLAALFVTTGLELSIALSDLGHPTGDIRICVFINSIDHNYVSNQFLGGLQAPQGSLGGDGAGGFTGTLAQLDMNDFAGDQFFTVPYVPSAPGTNYCTSGPNSTGLAATMSATGSASLSANDLTLFAATVPNQLGLFFHSTTKTNVPFGNGTRCVSGAVVRLLPTSVSAGGTAVRVLDLAALGFAPGTVNFQYGFRDTAAGGAEFDLSDGYAITFIP